jgi:hypothetical protein
MKNDLDIEDVLKRYRHKPDSGIKRSILARFADKTRLRVKPHQSGLPGFWHRPVPLYLVAAQIIVAVGLGFFASRFVPVSKVGSETVQERSAHIEAGEQPLDALETEELSWEIAPNDLL